MASKMTRYLCIVCLVAGAQLINAQQLQQVPGKLSTLASKLHRDKDIQEDISKLACDGQHVANSFKTMLQNDGSKILTEKNRLVRTSTPTDVKVETLQKTLKAARSTLESEQKDIVALEKDIQSSIETCNGRRTQHDTTRQNSNQRLETLLNEIASLNENINVHDQSIGTLEQSARDLDTQAENLRDEARLNGIFRGVIGGILGVALAPFTGGASLAIATVLAGIHTGINLNDADDCNRNARRLREEATSKRTQANNLRSKRDALEEEKRNLEDQIKALQTSSDELQQAAGGLQGVGDYLRSSVNVINAFLEAIEDMDTAMKEAELKSNSFVIIQNAFARHPEKTEAKSQVFIDKLKEKWIRIENILVQHGAKASLT